MRLSTLSTPSLAIVGLGKSLSRTTRLFILLSFVPPPSCSSSLCPRRWEKPTEFSGFITDLETAISGNILALRSFVFLVLCGLSFSRDLEPNYLRVSLAVLSPVAGGRREGKDWYPSRCFLSGSYGNSSYHVGRYYSRLPRYQHQHASKAPSPNCS